ncbi:MAG: DUF1015 domain-containing protein [Clostridia bacterium]|nr:DUF1015 domain-containing protein [Clostridia bacterium]
MSVLRPFKAIRPKKEYVEKIAALPYDVMNSAEAREMVKDNPLSFIHVDKAEVDLPESADLYSDAVYAKAAKNLNALSADGYMQQETAPTLYVYRQIMNGRAQTGIVGCVSVDDYLHNVIKKHEFTRADKEADRIRHVDACDANTGPIFLTYRGSDAVDAILAKYTAGTPEYDFITDDGITNTVWVVSDAADVQALTDAFAGVESLYIADGHHRAASAVKVGLKRREQNPDYTGEEEFNYFLAVLFKSDELEILDYNRVLADLNGNTVPELIAALEEKFTVTPVGAQAYKPAEKHTFGMYTDGQWYALKAKPGLVDESDPVARLDVSILQNHVIAPIFGIDDPRTDKRIDFVGGIRGLAELEKRANSDMRLAFSMYPTTLDDLMAIADANLVMPPKSTWFEPKLLSGLFIHKLSE